MQLPTGRLPFSQDVCTPSPFDLITRRILPHVRSKISAHVLTPQKWSHSPHDLGVVLTKLGLLISPSTLERATEICQWISGFILYQQLILRCTWHGSSHSTDLLLWYFRKSDNL